MDIGLPQLLGDLACWQVEILCNLVRENNLALLITLHSVVVFAATFPPKCRLENVIGLACQGIAESGNTKPSSDDRSARVPKLQHRSRGADHCLSSFPFQQLNLICHFHSWWILVRQNTVLCCCLVPQPSQ